LKKKTAENAQTKSNSPELPCSATISSISACAMARIFGGKPAMARGTKAGLASLRIRT
jgi:hypothetical protein